MGPIELTLQSAGDNDFEYIYRLCERTMRSYVEADLGDCFEQVARPTIEKLLQRGKFSRIYVHNLLVGAVAYELHDTHIQLEEIYVEPAMQSQGLLVVSCGTQQSESLVVVEPGGHVGRLLLSLSTCPPGGCQEHGFERWN